MSEKLGPPISNASHDLQVEHTVFTTEGSIHETHLNISFRIRDKVYTREEMIGLLQHVLESQEKKG